MYETVCLIDNGVIQWFLSFTMGTIRTKDLKYMGATIQEPQVGELLNLIPYVLFCFILRGLHPSPYNEGNAGNFLKKKSCECCVRHMAKT
jgi:hypothetical protein